MLNDNARVRPRRSATKPKKIPPMAAAMSVIDITRPAMPDVMCRSRCAAGMTMEYSMTSMLSSIHPKDAAMSALRRAGSFARVQKPAPIPSTCVMYLPACLCRLVVRRCLWHGCGFGAVIQRLTSGAGGCCTGSGRAAGLSWRRGLRRCGRLGQYRAIAVHLPLNTVEELLLCAFDLELTITQILEVCMIIC